MQKWNKAINKYEKLIGVVLVILISVPLIISIVMSFLNIKWKWYTIIKNQGLHLWGEKSIWKKFDFYIRFNKFVHCGILFWCVLAQVVLYIVLKYMMRRRLHYFYMQTRKTLISLMIFTMIFYVTTLILSLTFFRFFDDMLLASIRISSKSLNKQIIYTIGIIINCIWFDFFIYYATNNINFKLYVEAMMYGYRVHNQFPKMSFLISKSWFMPEPDYEDSELSEEFDKFIYNRTESSSFYENSL